MHKMIFVSTLLFSSILFAQTSLINKERILMCNAAEKFAEQKTIIELDKAKCLKNKTIRSVQIAEDIRAVEGDLIFRMRDGGTIELNCELDYEDAPDSGNIMGGILMGVHCS